jgi:protoheme IX farnesyltransferase
MSTATQPVAIPRSTAALAFRDWAELVKARVTMLIVLTAWTGFYFGAAKSGVSSMTWTLLHALLGIGLVSAGAAALNEAIERDTDALMRRTAIRPLVTKRIPLAWGFAAGVAFVGGGAIYLAFTCNPLTGALSLLTALVYLAAYTPLKKIHPLCTAVGAFPGAMPPLLGWTAARGRVEWEALVLFAIVFLWQFPHFHAIAWLYREDYERAGIRMLPVVEDTGRKTARSIMFYLATLLPVTLLPVWFHMSGRAYMDIAVVGGLAFMTVGWRLANSGLTPQQGRSKRLARHVLLASVFYLPLLFAAMMISAA